MKKDKLSTNKSIVNIKSKYCLNPELSDKFLSDVLTITGYEVDDEGYIVDTEEDPMWPEYVQCKGRLLRLTNAGIVHATDVIFDPYYNATIMEELFKQYLTAVHPEVTTAQIHIQDKTVPRADMYGYITILYSDGSTIKTALHYKDSTKYLDAFMRLESMTNDIIMEKLQPYDEYEAEFFKKYKTLNPVIAMDAKK